MYCVSLQWINSHFFMNLTSPQSYEYARSGVKIVSLEPMYVSTRMVGYSSLLDRPSLGVPSAETYVRHALQGCHFDNHCDIFAV